MVPDAGCETTVKVLGSTAGPPVIKSSTLKTSFGGCEVVSVDVEEPVAYAPVPGAIASVEL